MQQFRNYNELSIKILENNEITNQLAILSKIHLGCLYV